MKIVMIGAGAVGGYFGARLASAGVDVSFLLREESARIIRAKGLRVRSPQGDVHLPHPDVILAGSNAPAPDALFFACKVEHVRAAAEGARPLMGPSSVAIPLQNGVDAPSILRNVLGEQSVLGGLSRIFAERVATAEIQHFGLHPSITCGELEGGHSERVARVVNALADVPGMSIDASDDIWTAMWMKLLMVCSMGSVGAVARAPLGVVLGVPETRGLLLAAGEEMAAVGRAHGAQIPDGFVAAQVARYEGLRPETTASMHRDLERGETSELNEQLGAVCRYGRELKIATPVLDALYGALLPGELRARGRLAYESVGPRSDS
ncbi:MAG: 2-dehydropantoate 2-reductase [Bryobacterales bacterium]|nr:2-dehydropantoate 2-reductase [Bryobacterales bacterium]